MSLIPPNGDWKVQVMQKQWHHKSMGTDILIYREIDDRGTLRVLYIEDTNEWIFCDKEINALTTIDEVKPSLRLPANVAEALVAALVNNGVKPPDEHKLAGLYEAQSKHLRDLQEVIAKILDIRPRLIERDKKNDKI
jgi:hypothetical protein